MAVVALADDVQIEAETVDMSFSRARKCQAPVRRVRGIVEIERLVRPGARSDAFDRESQDTRDRRRALQPGEIELDRFEFDATEIADQMLTDERRRAARLAA